MLMVILFVNVFRYMRRCKVSETNFSRFGTLIWHPPGLARLPPRIDRARLPDQTLLKFYGKACRDPAPVGSDDTRVGIGSWVRGC